ncbi:hypothetical protein TKK_0000675 [Trichogramma kaykai]|uniref:Uncharacterized protein n=1 Tax=Trichogramma kaykai TaxID=54128 RepID=A0ABD2VZU5_9HYME
MSKRERKAFNESLDEENAVVRNSLANWKQYRDKKFGPLPPRETETEFYRRLTDGQIPYLVPYTGRGDEEQNEDDKVEEVKEIDKVDEVDENS